MPCNSDYMRATDFEKSISQVACLLDELAGKKYEKSHWTGYHPRVYNQKCDGDALVRELCSKLQRLDVSKYSLEMQIWWRDHQAADAARKAKEAHEKHTKQQRDAVLAKLTPAERKILGV